MKVDLTANEKKQLDNAVKENIVHKWLANKEVMKFEIGDVLLKYRRGYNPDMHGNYEWKPENIMSDLKMPQRYVYIFEDEFGIGYVKPLKVSDGKLGKELLCMTEFDWTHVRFQVDPEYAEHVLLDSEFDIKDQHKKSMQGRKQVTKMNRKIGIKPKTINEFNNFFGKLKAEDKFWTSADYTGKYFNEYTVKTLSMTPTSQINSWDWKRWLGKNPAGVDAPHLVTFSYTDRYNLTPRQANPLELGNKIFYLQEPIKEEPKK